MAYLETISNYPPYMAASDKRGFISQYYGHNGHTGVDSVGNLWDMPVCAIFDGKISGTNYTVSTGYEVSYQSVNGRVKVTYLHLRDKVTASGSVKKNQVIGHEGQTGALAKGKHLHVTMYIDGGRVDPLPYLKGEKALPLELSNSIKEEIYMIRKVTRPLNIRSTPSVANDSNIVYRDMPAGTVFLVTEDKWDGDYHWGKVIATVDGESYAGWCNILDASNGGWSDEV